MDKNNIPFSLTVPDHPKTLDELTEAELNAKLQHSYDQAISRQGKPAMEVFDELERMQ